MPLLQRKLIPALCAVTLAATFCSANAAAGAALSLQIGVSPPPLRAETPPRAHRRGLVWLPGYWGWNGRAYVWVSGHYERARHGYGYVPPNWQLAGNVWVFQPGYWVPAGSAPVQLAPAAGVVLQEPPGAPPMVQAARRDFLARGLPEDAFYSDAFDYQST